MRSFLLLFFFFFFFLLFGFMGFCTSFPLEIFPALRSTHDSSLASALTRVKKDAESIPYIEECAFVESWQEQPGFINVLSFLDASWEYSHRQATMLKMLQSRLEKSGVTGIRFFVINSAKPEAAVNVGDVEDEKKAWDEAELDDQHYAVIEKNRKTLQEKIGDDIAFLQDNDELKIWDKLSASRDQVLVIDKCGRLSYRVIVPWSILHFPYVKAAILSTYKEQPCGMCEFVLQQETTTLAPETETGTEELEEFLSEDWNLKKIEEIVVGKYNLDQTDSVAKKIYHGIESQEIPENVIKLLNESATIKQENNTDLNNDKKFQALVANNDSNFDDISYAVTPLPRKINTNDNEKDTLDYNTRTESPQIIYQNKDSVELKSTQNFEDETFYSTEAIEYRQESSESIDVTNISKNFEKTESLERESSYAAGNDFHDNNNSDSEDWNTSLSSTEDRIDNQIKISAEDNSESNDYVIPIRIIMHAPHIHQFDEPRNKHEYLVLKLGEPKYHGHLEYDDDFVSVDSVEQSRVSETEIHGSEEFGSGEASQVDDNIKKHRRYENSKHMNVIYDKDESPGFYGEDSEYWTNFGNVEYDQKLQIEEPSKYVNISDSIYSTSESSAPENKFTHQDTTTNIYPSEKNENKIEVEKYDEKESEIADHLFEHYSKLIPWLEYVID